MRTVLLLILCGGCGVRNDARYCDPATPCSDPAFPYCDPVARECQPTPVGEVDLAMALDLTVVVPVDLGEDLTTFEDLSGQPDLTPLDDLSPLDDLTPLPDLTPACVTSATCLDPALPICDSTQVCRACTGAGDDTACALHGAGLHCKLAGTNAGRCVACNTNPDCPAANPVCDPDGTCRKCAFHSECASGVCDLRPGTAGTGTCVAASDVIYVNNADAGCGTGDGTAAKPYCQLTTAAANLNGKVFVKVAPSATLYNFVPVGGSSLTVYFAGGVFGNQPILNNGGIGNHAFELIALNNQTLNITFDGFDFRGRGGSSTIYCDSGNTTATMAVRNSVINGGDRAANINKCNATFGETAMYNGAVEGIALNDNSNWDIHNCFIALSAGVGVTITGGSGNGSFRFNTVTQNDSGDNKGGVNCGKATTLDSSIIFNNAHSPPTTGTQFNGSCTLTNVVTGTDSISSAGKLSGTPVFRDTTPATLDLRLKVDAPGDLTSNQACCIDKVAAGSNTIDIEREHRPKGANADVGGDEAL